MKRRELWIAVGLVIALLMALALTGPCAPDPAAPPQSGSSLPATAEASSKSVRAHSKTPLVAFDPDLTLPPDTQEALAPVVVKFRVLQHQRVGRDTAFPGVEVSFVPADGKPMRATTDENGHATVRGPAGACDLIVRHPGYQVDTQKIAFRAGHQTTRNVTLHPGALIAVRVVTGPDATPVPEAYVWLRYGGQGPSGMSWNATSDVAFGQTDPEGRWEHDGMAPVRSARIEVQAHGYARAAEFAFAFGTERVELTVELEPEGRIRGVVLEADGQPVRGARVHVLPAGLSEWMRRHVRPQIIVADRKGRFELEGLAPSSVYEVIVEHHGRHTPPIHVRFGEGKRVAEQELRFAPMRRVTFRLLNPDGTEVTDAGDVILTRLFLSSEASPEIVQNVVGDKVCPVAVGRYRAVIALEDHPLAFDGEIVISDSSPDVIDLQFRPRMPIEGRVVGPDGEPLADVTVTAWPEMQPDDQLETETGEDGRFRLEGASAGSWVLIAEHNHAPEMRRLLQLPAPFQELQVRSSGSVRLQFPTELRDYRAQTVFWAPVVASPNAVDGWVQEVWQGGMAQDEVHNELPPGPIRVEIRVQGFLPWSTLTEVKPGAQTTVAVGPFQQGVQVSGRLVDDAGEPVHQVDVWLHLDADRAIQHRTDHDGRFPPFGVEPGEHTLSLSVRGWAYQRIHLRAVKDPVHLNLQLARGARVAFEVSAAGGLSAPGIDLRIEDREGRLFREHIRSDHRGRAAVVVPPGLWQVRTETGEPVPFTAVDQQEQTIQLKAH